MSYNKYNTRNSGRYNTGQFVPAGELEARQNAQQYYPPMQQSVNRKPNSNRQEATHRTHQPEPLPPSQQPLPPQQVEDIKSEETAEELTEEEQGQDPSRPAWMKSKLQGVKKLSNKERRRRQNESLRRLITPKNALMVLNEMMPNEQIANQFKVDMDLPNQYYQNASPKFRADLVVEGIKYRGIGDSKILARNAAAEQAIRDLVIKRLARADSASPSADEPPPMLQLASYALHKLFAEWEQDGHKVPQMKAATPASAPAEPMEAEAAPKPNPPTVQPAARALPTNAADMHPCMLLTYMRPRLEYRELAAEGDRPQSMVYTFGVDVDGTTFIGRACNKKEARKAAAVAACVDLFGVTFANKPTASRPVHE